MNNFAFNLHKLPQTLGFATITMGAKENKRKVTFFAGTEITQEGRYSFRVRTRYGFRSIILIIYKNSEGYHDLLCTTDIEEGCWSNELECRHILLMARKELKKIIESRQRRVA